jgi:hypothetical protein
MFETKSGNTKLYSPLNGVNTDSSTWKKYPTQY